MPPAEPQPDGAPAPLPHFETDASPGDKCDEEVLDRVLEETVRSAQSGAVREMQALKQIGLRHAGQALSLRPITVELVQSVLSCRFQGWSTSSDLQQMSRTIAETLWHDPRAHDRLLVLWGRLTEVSAK